MDKDVILVGDVLQTLKGLADNSVDCGCSSPPYYGLRDYGTGIWIGGNPDCDHKGKPFRTRANVNNNTGTGTDNKNTEHYEPFKEVCKKCGATRLDFQIGLEPLPDCGAWTRVNHKIETRKVPTYDEDEKGNVTFTGWEHLKVQVPVDGIDLCGKCYVCKIVAIYREFRRVLKDTGVLWLNLGDTYNSASSSQNGRKDTGSTINPAPYYSNGDNGIGRKLVYGGLKTKDLMGIPWTVALALRADGWYLRQDIIWFKPNPMPESVRDRCTKAHEYIFLLSKTQRYYFDTQAILEPAAYDGRKDTKMKGSEKYNTSVIPGMEAHTGHSRGHERWPNRIRGHKEKSGEHGQKPQHHGEDIQSLPARNKRSVWNIATQPFPGAHFATFPEELPEICIKAGTSDYGNCADCGKPFVRIVERTGGTIGKGSWTLHENDLEMGMRTLNFTGAKKLMRNNDYKVETKGWQPTCECYGKFIIEVVPLAEPDAEGNTTEEITTYVPSIPIEEHPRVAPIVLDTFMGAGTTGLVAKKLGRNYIGCELREEYAQMAQNRIRKAMGLFA